MLIDNQLNSFATLEVDNAGRNYGSISKQKIKTRFSLLAKAIAADAKLVMLSGGLPTTCGRALFSTVATIWLLI